MISIYDRLETDFSHNGIVLADTISCTIEEELNGKYILELTHPIDEQGKWEYLIEENIIKADGQLFRIHKTEKDLEYVYVYARHIFYDLLHNFLEDVRPTDMNGTQALNHILSNTQYPHNFTSFSDVSNVNTQYHVRKNPVEAILGKDSLITRWGGELVRDNFEIRLLKNRGHNKGAQIAYGKNLLGLDVIRDMDSVVTRIMPVGREGLLLPEKYVDSQLINNYVFPRIKKIELNIYVNEDTTEEQAYDLMRQACNDLYNIDKVDIPYVNINADLVLLENTEEYKDLKALVDVDLGDIISCTDNPLKIQFEAKVIRVKKDLLSNRNVEVELGQYRKGFTDTLDRIKKEVDEIKQTSSEFDLKIEEVTELLTSALGGHVLKRPGELLIMDTDDISTATKVWRWNVNGFGYSNNGIEGPYRTAMTMNGEIVADFITAGTLNAALVKIIGNTDIPNSFFWDETGFRVYKINGTTIDQTTYILIDNEGIRFYENNKKIIEISFAKKGFVATHNDGSETIVDNEGFKRKIINNGNEYNYINLSYAGEGITTGEYEWRIESGNPRPTENELDNLNIGVSWIDIGNIDFKNRNFIVIPSFVGYNDIISGGGGDVNWTDYMAVNIKILDYDYVNARFKIRARVETLARYMTSYRYSRYYPAKFSYYAYAIT